MEDWKAIQILEYTKQYDDCSRGDSRIAINRAIDALYFEMRARELFQVVIELLGRQRESDTVLNMLEEIVYYDEMECDGNCLIEDIYHLLIDNS